SRVAARRPVRRPTAPGITLRVGRCGRCASDLGRAESKLFPLSAHYPAGLKILKEHSDIALVRCSCASCVGNSLDRILLLHRADAKDRQDSASKPRIPNHRGELVT